MCHRQLMLYTNSRYLSKTQPFNFINTCSCGYCSDCIRKKRSEWRLRAYYEAVNLFNNGDSGSFCLFDTLTYNDDHLKFFHDIYPDAIYNSWDYSCFCHDDVQKFFKILKIRLSRSGYSVVAKNLRYLLTSEYGTSEIKRGFRCTERPHYHILFYVNGNIDPLLFSRFVSEAWIHGKTDGIRPISCSRCPCKLFCHGYCIYKSRRYVLQNRVFSNMASLNKVVNYVTKYITKDLYLFKKLVNRALMCFTINNPNWSQSYSKRLEFRRFKHNVLPFHTQSIGFGACALDIEDMDYILNYNSIRMKIGKKSVVVSIPLSQYYRNKLFYDFKKIDGKVIRTLKPNFINYFVDRLELSINHLVSRFKIFDSSLPFDKACDIAKYVLVYRGVYADRDAFDLDYKEFFAMKLCKLPLSISIPNNLVYYCFNNEALRLLKMQCIKLTSSFDKDLSFSFDSFIRHDPDKCLCTSNNVSRFSGYDVFLDRYYSFVRDVGFNDDVIMAAGDAREYRYKVLGLKNSFC